MAAVSDDEKFRDLIFVQIYNKNVIRHNILNVHILRKRQV